MNDHDGFLQEILAHPDDDTPRLIYADFLEERGDPRSEFIRVQCELAGLTAVRESWQGRYPGLYPYGLPEPRDVRHAFRFNALRERQTALLIKHCATWAAPFGPDATGLRLERGFVEVLNTNADAFVRRAPQWYQLTPLRQVRLDATGGAWPAFLASPFVVHLTALEIVYELTVTEVEALARTPALRNLRHLSLGGSIGDRGAQALVNSAHLARLVTLRTSGIGGTAQETLRRRFPGGQ